MICNEICVNPRDLRAFWVGGRIVRTL